METKLLDLKTIQITVVGFGYVGLPLAVEFGKKYPTVGFDINESRVSELKNGIDRTKEMQPPTPEGGFASTTVSEENGGSLWAEHLSFTTLLTPPSGAGGQFTSSPYQHR